MNRAARLRNLWQRDPVAWHSDCVGGKLWKKQEDMLWSCVKNQITTIPAGYGVSKSHTLARAAGHWLTTKPESRVIITGPTRNQTEFILWSEIQKMHAKSVLDLGGTIRTLNWTIDKDLGWYMIGINPRVENIEDTAERMAGLHAPGGTLVVIEEAGAVKDAIWNAVDGLLMSKNDHVLAAGQPMRKDSGFYRWGIRKGAKRIRISCMDSPNIKTGKVVIPGLVTMDFVDRMDVEWGRTHPQYKIRVHGMFQEKVSDAAFPTHVLEEATDRDRPEDAAKEPMLGIDVAWKGADDSVIIELRGKSYSYPPEGGTITGPDTMELVGRAFTIWKRIGGRIAVDVIGVGVGVAQRLRELMPEGKKDRVVYVDFGETAREPDRYTNVRAEAYCLLSEDKEEFSLPDDRLIKQELNHLEIKYHSNSRRSITPKDALRKLIQRSTDRADAAAIARWAQEHAGRIKSGAWISSRGGPKK